jgi:enoyl-CoA hydratase/carnithine racemase
VEECPLPVIAAINGPALGGGLELAVSCDLRLAHTNARLGIPAARLGIVYSQTGLAKFTRLVGPAHARMLFFTGNRLTASAAERIGLVNQAVAAGDFEAAVDGVAREIAANAPFAVQSMKKILRWSERGTPISEAEEREIHALRRHAFHSRDFEEGRVAFAAKRPPRFTGR